MKKVILENRVVYLNMTPEEAEELHKQKRIRKIEAMSNAELLLLLEDLLDSYTFPEIVKWEIKQVRSEILARMCDKESATQARFSEYLKKCREQGTAWPK